MPTPPRLRKANGPAVAAMLAAGVGTFTIGLLVVLVEALPPVRAILNWDVRPGGTLIGKSGVGVIVWLIVWRALHVRWQHRDIAVQWAMTWTVILIALSFIATFPPVFRVFTR